VAEAMRRLVEREFAGLLRASRSLGGSGIEPGSIHLATGRIRIELLGEDRDRPSLWIDLEERSGVLESGISRPGWLESLDDARRRTLADALAALYKISGVERVGTPGADRVAPVSVAFRDVVIPWSAWEAAWEHEANPVSEPREPPWRAAALPAQEG